MFQPRTLRPLPVVEEGGYDRDLSAQLLAAGKPAVSFLARSVRPSRLKNKFFARPDDSMSRPRPAQPASPPADPITTETGDPITDQNGEPIFAARRT